MLEMFDNKLFILKKLYEVGILKCKVGFFDRSIWLIYYKILTIISVVFGIMGAFLPLDDNVKIIAGTIILLLLLIFYIGVWYYCNTLKIIKLKINLSSIDISFGDFFSEESDIKAVAFNEYFDTIVDDVLIAKKSLNGQYIEKYYSNGTDELDVRIENDAHLKSKIFEKNVNRSQGKNTKYELGTTYNDNGFLLIALTHFDTDNKAYLNFNDYINCLLNFWNEVDRLYANRTIVIPVLGSGITRFKDSGNVTDQELLELMIWTFKLSRVKFTYPSKVKIVVWDQKSDMINLVALKKFEA